MKSNPSNSQLAEIYGNSYAGAYLDASGVLHVNLVKSANNANASAPDDPALEVNYVTYSLAYLQKLSADIFSSASVHAYSTNIDERDNKVIVTFNLNPSPDQINNVKRLANEDAYLITVNSSEETVKL